MPKPTKKEESDRLDAVEERKVLIEILKETGQDLKKAILEKDRDEVTILLQQFILEKEKIDLRSRRIENLPKDEIATAIPSSSTTKSRLAAAIASGLRSFAIHVFVTGHVPRCHAATCRMMLGDLNSWFFHGGQRWGRRHQVLLRVWACLGRLGCTWLVFSRMRIPHQRAHV